MPKYEFESNEPKIFPKNSFSIGFAGSQLYADIISRLIFEEEDVENLHEAVNVISKFISNEREDSIKKEIKRRTGIGKPEKFFTDSNLPIPRKIRENIYGRMGSRQFPIVNSQCLVAGFDEDCIARLEVINHEGDTYEATNFVNASIGSGGPFSTIYFDQYGYNKDMNLEESLLFSYEAKKWAEAPTGVGKITDLVLLTKTEDEVVAVREIYDGHPLLEKMENYYQKKRKEIEKNRKAIREDIRESLPKPTEV